MPVDARRALPWAFVLLALSASSALAVPLQFTVQGRLTDANGVNRDGTFAIAVRLWSDATGGTLLYKQTQAAVPVVNGNFQILVGGAPDSDSPNPSLDRVFTGSPSYLEFQAGSETPMVPRQPLLSVPYAVKAGVSDSVAGPVGGATLSTGSVVVAADTDANGDGDVIVRRSNVERLRVTAQGVGIPGLTAPDPYLTPAFGTEPLDVNGDVRTTGNVLSSGFRSFRGVVGMTMSDGGGFHVQSCGASTGVGASWDFNGMTAMSLKSIQCGGIVFSVNGAKAFIENDPTNPTRTISYYSLEGPEAGVYVRGTAQLAGGQATVTLPEHFGIVASPSVGLTAQLTPAGDCKGLYVASLTLQTLVVKEAQGGTSSVSFYYFVQGTRRGFETLPVFQAKTGGQ